MKNTDKRINLFLCLLLLLPLLNCVSFSVKPPADDHPVETGEFLLTDLQSLQQLAVEAYQKKDYPTAADYYLEIVKHNITDNRSIYNLACCYGLMNDPHKAAFYLERSVAAGFDNLNHISQDPDFDPVRNSTPFINAMASITETLAISETDIGNIWFFKSDFFIKTRLILPENYDTSRFYPLVIGLHGIGGNADNFVTIFNSIKNTDFIYAALEAPYAIDAGDGIGYSWNLRYEQDQKLLRQSWLLSASYIVNAVQELKSNYAIDETYLLGFSQGAGTATLTGIKYPDFVTGVIQIGGWLDTDTISDDDLAAASNLKFFILHGTQDQSVVFDNAIQTKTILEKFNIDVHFQEFDGGHRIPLEGLKSISNWILTQ